ncbi:MAG: hypothetical protein QG673_2202 [Pseudomonadota bacterium]|jgi:hypothetical protein|nr:hypothetical protein [Burkholderiales bacterium]MBP9769840.1 hypothetical protein [Burkholderiales bacterium]MDQ5922143.1 hypothetical protein [Pseudomonadota bacterium]
MATSSFTADLTLTYKKAKSFFEILESNKPSNNEIRRDYNIMRPFVKTTN